MQAVLAGVLGLVGAVLAALAGSFVVLVVASFEPTAAVVPLALILLLVVRSHFAGALLLLCRRSGKLLVLSAVPLAAVGALLLSGDLSPSFTSVPVGSGACAAASAVLAASAPVRRWTATRPGRLAPLHEEVRWL